jgi:hypothetical protein
MRALFEQAGLDIQAQPATVSHFVRIHHRYARQQAGTPA